MAMGLLEVTRELERGHWRPIYLIVGQEPYQSHEIKQALKAFFLKGSVAQNFQFDQYDGEGLEAADILASLDTVATLFDDENSDKRLVFCGQFDKVPSSQLEKMGRYFENPNPKCCLAIFTTKADKRKPWIKKLYDTGSVLEIREPYEREWGKWQGHFEGKIGKKISPEAWERLVASSSQSLALLWSDLQRVAALVGNNPKIQVQDTDHFIAQSGSQNVFDFADAVVQKQKTRSLLLYTQLIQSGESPIKLLALLLRQFRLVHQFLGLGGELNVHLQQNSRVIAARLGVSPYFVPKISNQARKYDRREIGKALSMLSESDYQLKTGTGDLFEGFLIPFLKGV